MTTNPAEVVAATAELLCATYVRHKPYHLNGYYACDRCRNNASFWVDWVSRGRALAEQRTEAAS